MSDRAANPKEYRAHVDHGGILVQLDVVVHHGIWLPDADQLAATIGEAVAGASAVVRAGLLKQQQIEPAPF